MANGHGGARRGAGRPRKPPTLLSLGATDDPLKFLAAVMNSADVDAKLRTDAAKALLPFLCERPKADGKKVLAKAAAKVASSGRFGPQAAPPHLVVVRKKPD